MKEEIWLPLPQNENYHVSSLGRVKSFRRNLSGDICPINTNNLGYKKVSIIHDDVPMYAPGRTKNYYLHVLVARIFVPNPNNYPEVNHKDRDKANNAMENLEWCTHKQNVQHSYLTRVTPKGRDHWRYGKKSSPEARKLQSQAKVGEKHPKFKGWYVHTQDGVVTEYASSILAQKDTGICNKTIIRWTNTNKNGWSFKAKNSDIAISDSAFTHNTEQEK